MRNIDLETWPRKNHFQKFIHFDHPHFNMCANLDVTRFVPAVKARQHSFTLAILYLLTRSANLIPEFRYRIRSGMVVEHEIVHPSTTIMTAGELFTFCSFEYHDDFTAFAKKAAEQIAWVQSHPSLYDEPGRDDLLLSTAIPWVSFTSFTHPMNLLPADSIPRFAWGKYFSEGESIKMPLSVQGHHALMDGVHMGRFYNLLQEHLDDTHVLEAH